LKCNKLPDECQKVLGKAAAPAAPAPTEQATAAATTTTAAATTTKKPTTIAPKTTKAQTVAAASNSAPIGPSSSAAGSSTTGCQDQHQFCCFWADDKARGRSECDTNSKWMKTMCQKACGTCGCTGDSCPTKVNTDGCQFVNGGNGQGQGQGSSMTKIFISGNGNGGGGQMNGSPGFSNQASGASMGNSVVNPGNGNSGNPAGPPPGLQRITFGRKK